MNADSPAAFLADARRAAAAADALLADAELALAANAGEPADLRQRATHGFAWFATYAEAIRAIAAHVEDLAHAGALDGFEIDLAGVALGEYLAQMAGGIAMSPGEIVRPTDLGLDPAAVAARLDAPLLAFAAARNAPGPRARLAAALAEGREPAEGEDADLAAMRRTMRDFAARELAEQGHRWHLDDAYIPMAVV
ncbi:MAG: acyl-CoA dehydrogenase, partial [Tagaea sp.]